MDLERLLPKTRAGMGNSVNENKLDLVYRDGQSFFVPARVSEVKINGIRR